MEDLEGKKDTANENIGGSEDEPTAEQKLETAQAELKAERDAREKAEKRTQGLEGSIRQKDLQLKGQATKADIATINRQMEVLATAVAMGRNPDSMDDVSEDTRNAVVEQIKAVRKESEDAQQRANIDASNQKYAEDALAIWLETKEIIPETDRDAVEIYRLLKGGDKDTAGKMLNSIKANKKPEGTDKTETEEELKDRLTKEILKERGLLKNEAITPSGGVRVFSRLQIAGMSPQEYAENKEDIAKARQAGKIKE